MRRMEYGPGHIIDDNGRIARDMSAKMARDQTRVCVIAAAGRKADNDPQHLAAVKIALGESC
jgi:hypothetical protein